jgi:polyphosphate kinase 2
MRLKTFNFFINEEISISTLDDATLKSTKENFMFILNEYRTYILANIEYNLKTNKVEYRNFDKIDIKVIMRELTNEYTAEFIQELNVETFLIKLNQILELKKRNTKRKVRESFDEYYQSIENRIEQISKIEKGTGEEFEIPGGEGSILSRKQYESEKYQIQVELLKLQEWAQKTGQRISIVFEGRDSAGKGSTIKRFIEYLNPRGFKVVALGLPTDEEKNNWFGRYENHLPKPGEIVFFDRSWHNRSIVEPAMGYCTEEQYKDFMTNVNDWETNLVKNGMILIKLWFSITKEKQVNRFELRQQSPLKYWKFSPNDAKVLDKWEVISNFKNQMFIKNSTPLCPWVIINSNDKKIGRLNAMRYVLSVIPYDNKDESVCRYYNEVVNVIK